MVAPKAFRGKLPAFHRPNRKQLVILAVGLVVLLGLIAGVWETVFATNCEDYLPKGQGSLSYTQNDTLKMTVDKMRSVKNYDKNPDCLNVITTYYINTSDYQNAKLYMDKLEKVYNPHNGFSAKLMQAHPLSINELRSAIALLKKADDAIKTRGYLPHGRNK